MVVSFLSPGVLQSFLKIIFWLCHSTCGILVPWPDIKPTPLHWEREVWTTGSPRKPLFSLFCVGMYAMTRREIRMGERYQGLEMMEWGRQNKGRRHNIEADGKRPESCLPALSFQQRVSSRTPVGCSHCSQTLRISSPWEKGFSHQLSISFSCLFFIQSVSLPGLFI